MIRLPHFESEAEEADWWFRNQDLIAAEFECAKPKLGPSRALQFLAEQRGITVQELQAQVRAHGSDSTEPEALAKLPRSA